MAIAGCASALLLATATAPAGEIVNALLRAGGAPEVTGSVPFAVAYAAGAACEWLWPLLRLDGEPPMTRFLAEQLGTTHWYDMGPAERDFGYRPRVSTEEGLRRLAASLPSRVSEPALAAMARQELPTERGGWAGSLFLVRHPAYRAWPSMHFRTPHPPLNPRLFASAAPATR